MAVLKQKNNAPVDVAHQVCIIYAVTNGYLNNLTLEDIPEFEQQLFNLMDTRYYEALQAIRTTGKFEADTENAIKAALTELAAQFRQST